MILNKDLFEFLWKRFVEKERQTFLRGKRKYLHFDNKVGFPPNLLKDSEKFHEIFNRRFKKDFQSPEIVSKSYYPFIKVKISTPRYKWSDSLKKKTIELKERPICYASHYDALRYAWYSTILEFCYEQFIENKEFNEAVLAYRKFNDKLSNIDFAFNAFNEIANRGNCVALAFDISKFFDTINHRVLFAAWVKVVKILYGESSKLPEEHYKLYKSITKFHYVDRSLLDDIFAFKSLEKTRRTRLCEPSEFRDYIADSKFLKINENFLGNNHIKSGGIPQGAPISAILANISMLEFDENIFSFVKNVGGRYYRYSDDLLFICDLKNECFIEQKVFELIETVGLKVNESKIEKIRFVKSITGDLTASDDKGRLKKLQYLGFEFDGSKIFIRSSSLSKYHSRLHRVTNRVVNMAFGKKSKRAKISKMKLLNRFTQKGKQNFIYYAKRAGEIKSESISIQNQYKRQYKNLNKTIRRKVNRKLKMLS